VAVADAEAVADEVAEAVAREQPPALFDT